MPRITGFTCGKNPIRNEDFMLYGNERMVLVDGATSKSDLLYDGQTGGEIISRVVAEQCLQAALKGAELVNFLHLQVQGLYDLLHIHDFEGNPLLRFAAGFIDVQINQDRLFLTYLGDLGFRVNGIYVFREEKIIDHLLAGKRAQYIRETGDEAGGRAHILPDLIAQLQWQNHPSHAHGYGVVDGTHTPDRFIKTFEWPLDQIQRLELFTDGYPKVPLGCTIADWEQAFAEVEADDPLRINHYASAKAKDDRSVLIIEW